MRIHRTNISRETILYLDGVYTVGELLQELDKDHYRGGWKAAFRLNAQPLVEGTYGQLYQDPNIPDQDRKIIGVVETVAWRPQMDLYEIRLEVE